MQGVSMSKGWIRSEDKWELCYRRDERINTLSRSHKCLRQCYQRVTLVTCVSVLTTLCEVVAVIVALRLSDPAVIRLSWRYAFRTHRNKLILTNRLMFQYFLLKNWSSPPIQSKRVLQCLELYCFFLLYCTTLLMKQAQPTNQKESHLPVTIIGKEFQDRNDLAADESRTTEIIIQYKNTLHGTKMKLLRVKPLGVETGRIRPIGI